MTSFINMDTLLEDQAYQVTKKVHKRMFLELNVKEWNKLVTLSEQLGTTPNDLAITLVNQGTHELTKTLRSKH